MSPRERCSGGMIGLWAALSLSPVLGRAQGTDAACGRVLQVSAGRTLTRTPEIEPPRPWVLPPPARDWQVFRMRRMAIGQPANRLDLVVAHRLFARLPHDDPHRPDLLMRIASVAWELADDRAWNVVDGPERPREGASACDHEVWRNAGWLAPRGPRPPVGDEVMSYCATTRAALEALAREYPQHLYDGLAATYLAAILLDAGDTPAAEAVAATLAERAPDAALLPSTLFLIADHHDRRGRPAEASRWFERCLRVVGDPDRRDEARYRLGLIRLEANDPGGALQFFAQAVSAGSHQVFYRDAVRASAMAFALSRVAAGSWSPRESMAWIARLAPGEPWRTMFEPMLVVLAGHGRPEWALAGYQHLLASVPRSAAPTPWIVGYARLFSETQARRETIAELTGLLDWSRGEPGSEAAMEDQVYATAARWHREALRTTPPDRTALRDAARLYGTLRSPRPLLYRAEALFEASDECESAYLDTLAVTADAGLRAEVRCKAAVCRERAIAAVRAADRGAPTARPSAGLMVGGSSASFSVAPTPLRMQQP